MPARIVTAAESAGRLKPPEPSRPEVSGFGTGFGTREPGTRLLLLVLAGALWAGAVVCRLVYLSVARHHAYQAMAARQQQRTLVIAPERGVITDRGGHELAVSLPVESCFAVPEEITDPESAARELGPIVGEPVADLAKRLEGSGMFAWVARRLAPDVVQRIRALHLDGIHFQQEMERFYPDRDLAAQVLGFVDIDGQGQAGIEYELNTQIAGRPGEMFVLADGHRRYYQLAERPPIPGAQVELTLDENVQYIAEKELAKAIADSGAIGGSVLVMRPSDGEVLALANWPTFDPNLPGEASPEARQNRAISDIYEPGSTFKTVTISAAIDSGAVTADEVFDCGMGHIVLAGRVIHDWHSFGLLSVGEVLMHSSDVGAIKIALKMGPTTFYDYMRAYGFGQKTGIALPWESPGMLRPPRLWSGTAIGSMAMGQSVGVTALQLVREVSAIANGGLLYRPQIIRRIELNGRNLAPAEPPPIRVMSETTAATMRHLMEGVVLGGTGRKAQLDGYTTAGKTGTAQKIDPATHLYSHTNFMASFVGFAPLNDPSVVTLVVLDSPKGLYQDGRWLTSWIYKEGGTAAAPVWKEVMQQVVSYLGVPRDLAVQPLEVADASKTAKRPTRAPMPAAPIVASAATPAVAPPPGMVVMPSLAGETVRQATAACLRLGLNPRLEGSGLAVDQNPGAGKQVRIGAAVLVRFALRPAATPPKLGSGNAP